MTELGLKTSKAKEMSVVAFGGEIQRIQCKTVRTKISMGRSMVHRVNLIVTDKVAMRLVVPGLRETATKLKQEGIKLADDYRSDVVDHV